MIKKLNESVDLNTLMNTDNNYTDYSVMVFPLVTIGIILFMIVFSQLIYIRLKRYKLFEFLNNNIIKKSLIALTVIFTIIAAPITGFISSNYMEAKDELKHGNPYYRDVNITGTIDDISIDNEEIYQKIRFTHDGKNYHVTIPSDISARPSDKIKVKIHHQLVDNRSKYNDLNDTLFYRTTDFKNSVEIQHDGNITKTHLFDLKKEKNDRLQRHLFD